MAKMPTFLSHAALQQLRPPSHAIVDRSTEQFGVEAPVRLHDAVRYRYSAW
jgi:hypothetical protein